MNIFDLFLLFTALGFLLVVLLIVVCSNSIKKELKGTEEYLKEMSLQISNMDKMIYGMEKMINSNGRCIIKVEEREKKAE